MATITNSINQENISKDLSHWLNKLYSGIAIPVSNLALDRVLLKIQGRLNLQQWRVVVNKSDYTVRLLMPQVIHSENGFFGIFLNDEVKRFTDAFDAKDYLVNYYKITEEKAEWYVTTAVDHIGTVIKAEGKY